MLLNFVPLGAFFLKYIFTYQKKEREEEEEGTTQTACLLFLFKKKNLSQLNIK